MKAIWRKITNSVYGRFFFNFTIVLILPSLIYSFYYLNYFQKIVKENVISQAQRSLDIAARELIRYEEELQAIAIQNSNLNIATPAYLRKDYNGRELCSQLQSEVATHTYIDQIFYYNTGVPGRIYCQQGTFTPDFFEQYMGTGQQDFSFLEYLENLKEYGWILYEEDSGSGKQGILYIFHVRNLGYNNYWAFHMDRRLLEELLKVEGSTTILYDTEGEQLYPFIPMEEQTPGDGELLKVESVEATFCLVRYYHGSDVFAQVQDIRNIFLISSFLVFVTGGSLVAWLSFCNKKPIDELKMYCESKCQEIPESLEGLEVFRFTINHLEEQKRLLERKRREERLLFRLIYEKGISGEELLEEMKSFGIFRQSDTWCALIVESHGEAEADTQNAFLLPMLLSDQYELYLSDESGKGIMAGILGMKRSGVEGMAGHLQEIARRISEKANSSIHIFVGGICQSAEELHWSYRQALRLLQSRQESSFWSVVCEENNAEAEIRLEEHIIKNTQFLYPELELNSLENALSEADYSKVSLVTDVLLEIVHDNREEYKNYIPLCFDILNVFNEAKEGLNVDSRELRKLLNRRDLRTLNRAEEFIDRINKVSELFVVALEEVCQEKQSDNLAVQIISFIDQNVRNPEISVNYIADKFGMSISNLSHQFKALTNQKISDYISEKKFGYVSKLLLETDYSIQRISEMTGYTQVSSFSYRFKKYFGMTPLEYREKYKSK